ncbi:Transcription factor Adf-1 [Anabarilius grahami]|uniref:Transcription factor Adf-1 n=1 Tax=Anabarilius grahami TaxID=495550 RepID=A0A3N0YA60_ANAGA|nr:Transcription factor Adf-1 [Anabarilius grahami]
MHPVLFDKTNKNYKDNDLKDNVWRSIANQLGYQDFEDAKKLWKNLRDTYVRKRREEKETKSGQAGKQRKRWKYMECMSFLEASTSFRRVCSNLEEEQQVVDDAGQGTSESEGEPSCPPPQKRKSKDFFEDYLTRKEAREEQKVREREEKDETYHFLMSLAPAMRRLPPEKQSWLKIKILEMFHEVEFSLPSTSAYTVL